MPADIAQVTAAHFTPHLDRNFHIAQPAGDVTLRLVAVQQLGEALRPGGAFSLLFISPPGPFLPQAIYPVANAEFGTLELFLVPLGPRDGGNSYEAVFT
jgi:hypothetical protein